jgi:hypothetical protein
MLDGPGWAYDKKQILDEGHPKRSQDVYPLLVLLQIHISWAFRDALLLEDLTYVKNNGSTSIEAALLSHILDCSSLGAGLTVSTQ